MSAKCDAPAHLSAQDFTNLIMEAPDTPMNVGVLVVLKGPGLLGPEGPLPLETIRARLASRLAHLPELRHVLHTRQPPGRRPTWVLVNLAVSNLIGPAAPLSLLGCSVIDAMPFTPIKGDVTIAFCALSYAGIFNIGLLADADSWPDLATLVNGMKASWAALRQGVATQPKAPQVDPK